MDRKCDSDRGISQSKHSRRIVPMTRVPIYKVLAGGREAAGGSAATPPARRGRVPGFFSPPPSPNPKLAPPYIVGAHRAPAGSRADGVGYAVLGGAAVPGAWQCPGGLPVPADRKPPGCH